MQHARPLSMQQEFVAPLAAFDVAERQRLAECMVQPITEAPANTHGPIHPLPATAESLIGVVPGLGPAWIEPEFFVIREPAVGVSGPASGQGAL